MHAEFTANAESKSRNRGNANTASLLSKAEKLHSPFFSPYIGRIYLNLEGPYMHPKRRLSPKANLDPKPYLEGHGHLVSSLIVRITRVTIWVIGVIKLLTKFP